MVRGQPSEPCFPFIGIIAEFPCALVKASLGGKNLPMNSRISVSLTLVLVASLEGVLAEPELESPPAERRWSVSAGLAVRELNAAFDFRPTVGLNWRNFMAAPGNGDPGLFTGGDDPVVYDDGVAGGENPDFPDFGARGRIDSASQISAIHSGVDPAGNIARTVAFHSLDYDQAGSFQTASDGSVGAGPSMQFAYRLGESMGTSFELQTGWSFVNSETATRTMELFEVHQVTNVYLYDYIANPLLPIGIPGTVDGSDELLIFNAEAVPSNFGTGYQSPRRGVSQRGSEPYAVALSSAELDTRLVEIPMGLAAWRELGPFQVGFNGGLTFNVIDYDLQSRLSWFQAGATEAVSQLGWNQSGTHLKVGMYAGLSARLPLSSDERIFLEATGSYRWVDPVHASAGPVDVEIDASSAEGRFGVGIVLW